MASISEFTDARNQLVSRVPDELWLEIFFHFTPEEYFRTEYEYPYAPRTSASGSLLRDNYFEQPRFPNQRDRKTLREIMDVLCALTLVNKRWYQIAVEVLYTVVYIGNEDTAALFRRSLDEVHGNPKLGAYVRHLLLVEITHGPRSARHLDSVFHLMSSMTIVSLSHRITRYVLPSSNPDSLFRKQGRHETLHLLSQVCGNTLRKLYIEAKSFFTIPLADKALSDALSNMTNLRSLTLDTNGLTYTFSPPDNAKHLSFFKFSEDLLFHPIALPECNPPFPSLTHMYVPLARANQDAILKSKLLARQGPHCSVLTIECPRIDANTPPRFGLATLFGYFPHVEQLNYVMPWTCPDFLTCLPPRTIHLVVTSGVGSLDIESEEQPDEASALSFIETLKSFASASRWTTKLKKVTIVHDGLASWLKLNAAAVATAMPPVAEYGFVRVENARGNPVPIFSVDG